MSEDILQEAINDIAGGAAICFVGAGFSYGATDASAKKQVPSVEDICKEICQFPGLENDFGAQLADLAEFCYDSESLKQKLISLFIDRLTLCNPTASHFHIMKMPWRAVFTTNFDDVAEKALKESNPLVITPVSDARNLRSDRKPLYYLHGRALDLLESVMDPRLVVSETNYLNIREKNRNLYSAFENEVHSARRIFFIGYSIRDAEIATRLFAIKGIKAKSIVICGPSETPVTLNRLKKFGEIFPIGVDKFSDFLPDHSTIPSKKHDLHLLRFVDYIEPLPAKAEISGDDVERLILAGVFDYGAFANQQHKRPQNPEYCVPRAKHISSIFDSKVNRFFVTSDFGNGKNIFLKQITFEAHSKGYEVFSVSVQLPETLSELDTILSSTAKRLYIVDGIVRFRKVVRHIGRRLPSTSILVCSSGSIVDEADYGNITEELGGASREIDLNVLDSVELSDWDYLLERWGFWEERIKEDRDERLEFLRMRCGAENRSIVISIFKNSILSTKIDNIVRYFVEKNYEYSRSFIAILMNALCSNHVEWSRIVEWLDIDEYSLKRAVMSSPVGNFLSGTSRWYEFTSTELASFIFNDYDFDVEQIVDVYTKIVRETAYAANDPRGGSDARENLKELMRFRFLTRLFCHPSTGTSAINAVYQRLSSVPRIRNNDQFWLQYAMARMEVNDLENAEIYLNTAIGLAEKRGVDYSKYQIIDQQVRLIFRKNTPKNTSVNQSEIVKACSSIEKLLNTDENSIVHPLRSSKFILEFLEEKIDKLDTKSTDSIKNNIFLMRNKLPSGRLGKSQKGETDVIKKNLRSCALILEM